MLEPEETSRRMSSERRRSLSRRKGFTTLLQEVEEEHEHEMSSLRTQLEGELRYLRGELDRLRVEQDRYRKDHRGTKFSSATSGAESTVLADMRTSRRSLAEKRRMKSQDPTASMLPASATSLAAQWRDQDPVQPRGSPDIDIPLQMQSCPDLHSGMTPAVSTQKTIPFSFSSSSKQLDSCESCIPHQQMAMVPMGSMDQSQAGQGMVSEEPALTKLTGDWDVTPLHAGALVSLTPTMLTRQASTESKKAAIQTHSNASSSSPVTWQEASGSQDIMTECSQDDMKESDKPPSFYSGYTHHLDDGSKCRGHERCMLSPVCKLRLMWDFLAFSFLILDLLITPFELVFLHEDAVPGGFAVINHIITIFFVSDLCLNFNTGYIERDKLIMRRRESVRKYLTTWFWIDLVATIPYDLVASTAMTSNVDGDALSMTRLAKVSKVLKTLRFLKMLRAVRLVQTLNSVEDLCDVFTPMQCLAPVFKGLVGLSLLAHIHGCIWATLQPGWEGGDSMQEALAHYYRCFYWAYQALAVGPAGFDQRSGFSPSMWTLEILIASERITLVALLGSWGVVKAMSLFHEGAQLSLVKQDALRFFRQHQVSIETQIQVMYSIHETRWAQQRQRHFRQLMSEHLPEELRRAISAEIWTDHLLSLGLILHINDWHEDFVTELCLVVREEVLASKTILCKEGNAAICAYYVTAGRLTVVGSHTYGLVPDFVAGMWVGELALVNPARRRNATVATQCLTTLMVVPADAFGELISRLGLQSRYEHFRKAQLAQGLCGRCGVLGDHFTHACPLAVEPGVFRPLSRRLTYRKSLTWANLNARQSDCDEVCSTRSASLVEFLHAHRISRLAPYLEAEGIRNIDGLQNVDLHDFMDRVRGDGDPALQGQAELLRALQLELQGKLDADMRPEQHLVFLSHFKLEAGTEAALIHSELEKALLEEMDPQDDTWSGRTPVFLDSEDLYDLEDLQQHVRASSNLVVMLTKNVLTRPWVLVEIVTAVQAGVRLLPVQLVKPGDPFVFPTESFYTDLLEGKFLNGTGHEMLKQHNIGLEDVESALRELFKKIAVPYSPHRPESIRKAEVKALLKLCNLSNCNAESQLLRFQWSDHSLPKTPATSGHHRASSILSLVGHKVTR